ncbi:MAG: hypothetical protein VXY93_18300, partial [Pseudomonadota bacterium]|nr:hypothetical protein [Pseudomonadota bacterium]
FYPGSIVGKIQIGDSNGYEIFHYNNNNYLTFTRDLLIRGDNIGRQIRIQPKISQEGIMVKPDAAVELYHNGTKRLETSSVGVSIPQDLDVDGHTNLDNVSVAGVSTFAGAIDLNADLDVDGHTNLDNVSIAGVTTMSGNLSLESTYPRIYLKDTNHNPDFSILNNDGNLGFRDDTNGEYRLQVLGTGETKVYHNLIVDKDLDVDGHTN